MFEFIIATIVAIAIAIAIVKKATKKIDAPRAVKHIAQTVTGRGGRAFLVGGAVIDVLEGRTPKDWDIEVHGFSMEELKNVLQQEGFTFNECGRQFGVLKLPIDGLDIDLSIPRKENSVGLGHKDFEMSFDPDMTPEEAALRRDFTINAMFADILTGEIIDPYGGLEDLKNGVLRMTSAEKFVEDPLRALRAMQLLARKCKTVDDGTLRVIRNMATFPNFDALAKERIFEEFKKLLLKSSKPSIGLDLLNRSNWIGFFPALQDMADWGFEWDAHGFDSWSEGHPHFPECPHNLEHHPEGGVWTHTMIVVDNAAKIRDILPESQRLPFMFAALLHDVGKPCTTDPSNGFSAHGHDEKGEAIAESFLRQMTEEKDLIKKVCMLVNKHMQPWQCKDAKAAGWKRLAVKTSKAGNEVFRLLGYLSICDWSARPARHFAVSQFIGENPIAYENGERIPHVSEILHEYADQFDAKEAILKPVVGGNDVMEHWSIEQGPEVGKLLQLCHYMQIEKDLKTKEEILAAVDEKEWADEIPF